MGDYTSISETAKGRPKPEKGAKMLYKMSKTMQFGDAHWKKGEQIFVRPIHGTRNVLVSKRKHQPVCFTVSRSLLNTFVTVERIEPQEIVATTTVNGKAQHTFRHVGSVVLGGQARTKVYTLDGQPESLYYVKQDDGLMRNVGSTAKHHGTFKAREEW